MNNNLDHVGVQDLESALNDIDLKDLSKPLSEFINTTNINTVKDAISDAKNVFEAIDTSELETLSHDIFNQDIFQDISAETIHETVENLTSQIINTPVSEIIAEVEPIVSEVLDIAVPLINNIPNIDALLTSVPKDIDVEAIYDDISTTIEPALKELPSYDEVAEIIDPLFADDANIEDVFGDLEGLAKPIIEELQQEAQDAIDDIVHWAEDLFDGMFM